MNKLKHKPENTLKQLGLLRFDSITFFFFALPSKMETQKLTLVMRENNNNNDYILSSSLEF